MIVYALDIPRIVVPVRVIFLTGKARASRNTTPVIAGRRRR